MKKRLRRKRDKHSLEVLSLGALSGLTESLQACREKLKLATDEELWYRGVPSNNFVLLPSLHRALGDASKNSETLRALEADLFFEFLAKARRGEGANLDHWDVLFLMQHYRAPTRLLDWTEVLFVALYFAVLEIPSDHPRTPRVFVMNPYRWNEYHDYGEDLYWPRYFGYEDGYFYEYGEILLESDGVDWAAPVALYPPQRDARLSAQRGFFTIHGSDPRPMEEIAPQLLMAIDLEPLAVKEVKEMLQLAGIDEFALFPDLEGLAGALRKKYGLGSSTAKEASVHPLSSTKSS
jgi:hypothetical protein